MYPLSSQSHPSTSETVADVCTPTYYKPEGGTIVQYPPENEEYWVLVPGTPATCTQLGLFHFKDLFPHKEFKKVDLVLSGPNHGRNTSAVFSLSSGTLGGALEGAISGVRSIALSFAFFTGKEGEEKVREASIHGIRIIEKLCETWTIPLQANADHLQDSRDNGADSVTPDLYTINVPLVDNVSSKPIQWTWMLDSKWPDGSLYKVVDETESDGASSKDRNLSPPSFKWAPSFTSVWRIVDESPAGNDAKVVRNSITSITPLKANFQTLFGKPPFSGEFKL